MNLRFWEKKEQTPLEIEIERVYTSMKVYGADSPEYKKLLKYQERLHKLNANERGKKKASPDTKWIVIGNILGILAIIGYESRHVFTSKAAANILKPKF